MTEERHSKIEAVLNNRQPNIQDPRNITAVMRTCESIGINEIHVIITQTLRFKKLEFKSGMSAFKWMKVHEYTSTEACIKALKQQNFCIYSTHLSSTAVDLYDIDFTQKIALVFGNEHNGISAELHALTDKNFIVPQVGMVKSLNISVACAVTLYEAYRQKQIAGHYSKSQLTQEQKAEVLKSWNVVEGKWD
jgi:tRNA (guanosine-2'-O-)-methyltransferase